MRIVTLMENSPGSAGCAFEHGLSFYIETERRRILSDTGASAAFLDNAALLGVPLETVDAVFLSHGHYDHAGGVLPFAQRNPRAVIYVQRTAELPYYAMDEDGFHYIGMDPKIAALPEIRFLDGDADIDGELSVLGRITGR
ncbi:MAG: MBL fold metallo-hydrolase, partial [Oscillospiraceae bacterium]|nr:MBL fold metallo-hydrolase [Oscillospiraceae bacterium]